MNATEGTATTIAAGPPRSPEASGEMLPVRALLLGERIDTRALERDGSLGAAPLTVDLPGGGVAVLFRYGVIVLFGQRSAVADKFVEGLAPSVVGAFPVPEQDEARLLIRPDSNQHVDA